MLNWRTHRSNVKSVCLICISPFIGNIHWNYTRLQGNDWHVIFHNSHRCHQFWQKHSIQFYTHVNLDICWLVYALYHSMHRTFAMKSMFRPNWPKTVFFLPGNSKPTNVFIRLPSYGSHRMSTHTKKPQWICACAWNVLHLMEFSQSSNMHIMKKNSREKNSAPWVEKPQRKMYAWLCALCPMRVEQKLFANSSAVGNQTEVLIEYVVSVCDAGKRKFCPKEKKWHPIE